ncbi:MAG TPA: homocysteine S-methyltransferase family protein [Candidatus Saccharimonadales bacterium]|nr:homocysteine S-methyltransferase family protein [Candidatus Saccharimonadales bacterium]
MSVKVLRKKLSGGRPVILDGGFGELVRGSYKGSTEGPLWATSALFTPDGRQVVANVHAAYAQHADVITTGTFRAQPGTVVDHELKRPGNSSFPRAEMNGVTDPSRLSRLAIVTAGELAIAARRDSTRALEVILAGSVGPLKDCYKPGDTPTNAELEAEHAQIAESFFASGVDFVSVETIPTIRESIIAAKAAKEAGLEYSINWWGDRGGVGHEETFAQAMNAIEEAGLDPLYIGFNCVRLEDADATLANLLAVAGSRPVAVSANGNPSKYDHNSCDNPGYAKAAERWVDMGVAANVGAMLIGGCCGTTPETIAGVRAALIR